VAHLGTPGGIRLRLLREAAGQTQLAVELDADLGTGYLQRVESGKVSHPERDTLERILMALGARYTERRDILELFGYNVDAPLPDVSDIEWAIGLCQVELNSAVFPAYLLDCAHQLLAWNPIFPRLLPQETQAHLSASHTRLSILRMLFDRAYGLTPHITNPDMFFPASIRALRCEIQLFRGEGWYDTLIQTIVRDCPLFEKYWTKSQVGQPSQIAARPLTPLALDTPPGHTQFRIMSEPFTQDRRFRVIYWMPADETTIQCLTRFQVSPVAL